MEKQLIHVWQFTDGSVYVGTIERTPRKRALYVPSKSGALSPKMEWQNVQIVSICGVDYIPDPVFSNSGEQKVGDQDLGGVTC
jgi:hypothetical protein